jgi:hypothetical protein
MPFACSIPLRPSRITHQEDVMSFTRVLAGIAVGTVAVICLTPLPASATVVPVPEPETWGLLSSGLAVAVIGYRWFRRR